MENKYVDITVQYVDEIRCRILTRKEILYSLKTEFSFFANGYKFHPLYKQGRWDGRISMIDGKGLFYNGLLKALLTHCKERGLSIKVEDIQKYMPTKIEDSVIDQLSSYIKFPPYDYQQRSVKEALSKRKLLILSPTSSGKSLIAYMLYRYCVDNNLPLLITVPSVGLVTQLLSDFESYVSDDHNVAENVHTIYTGQEKITDKLCTISTWQSCTNMDKEWFSRYKFYICDEAHGSSAKEISAIIDNLNNCPHRIGMTGTLNGTNIHEIEMHARFGEIFKMVTTRELIDRGLVTDIDINCVRLIHDKIEIDRFHGFCKNDYQREIDYLLNSTERNDYIINLGLTLPNTTLMLFNRIEGHGMKLMEQLEEKALQYRKKVFYIAGSVKAKERERIRKQLDGEMPLFHVITFNDGSTATIDANAISQDDLAVYRDKSLPLDLLDEQYMFIQPGTNNRTVTNIELVEGSYILLASYGTMSTGISIKKLHNLIFCHPFKGKILNLQSIGRILRKSNDKNKVYLYDLIDDYRKGKKINHTYKHGTARMEIYESEEFNYELIEQKI